MIHVRASQSLTLAMLRGEIPRDRRSLFHGGSFSRHETVSASDSGAVSR